LDRAGRPGRPVHQGGAAGWRHRPGGGTAGLRYRPGSRRLRRCPPGRDPRLGGKLALRCVTQRSPDSLTAGANWRSEHAMTVIPYAPAEGNTAPVDEPNCEPASVMAEAERIPRVLVLA